MDFTYTWCSNFSYIRFIKFKIIRICVSWRMNDYMKICFWILIVERDWYIYIWYYLIWTFFIGQSYCRIDLQRCIRQRHKISTQNMDVYFIDRVVTFQTYHEVIGFQRCIPGCRSEIDIDNIDIDQLHFCQTSTLGNIFLNDITNNRIEYIIYCNILRYLPIYIYIYIYI